MLASTCQIRPGPKVQPFYWKEIKKIQVLIWKTKKCLNALKFSPYLDADGRLRVGIPEHEKHPILVPGRHHIAILLVRHYHDPTHHQGRHITEGAIRSVGIWITGGKYLISSISINTYVTCHKFSSSLAC